MICNSAFCMCRSVICFCSIFLNMTIFLNKSAAKVLIFFYIYKFFYWKIQIFFIFLSLRTIISYPSERLTLHFLLIAHYKKKSLPRHALSAAALSPASLPRHSLAMPSPRGSAAPLCRACPSPPCLRLYPAPLMHFLSTPRPPLPHGL